MDEILNVSRGLLESVFGGEIGSERFTITLASALFGALIVGWFLSRAFGSKKGIVGALIGISVPLFIGLAAYSLATVFAVPQIKQPWATDYLAWAVLGVTVFLAVIVLSKRVWDVGAIAASVVFAFSLSAAALAYFAIDSMMELSEQADDTAADRKQLLEETAE